MSVVIVDTNVALVANGSCAGVSPKCRLASMDFLEQLLHKGDIAIDLEGSIEEEYRKKLGVGYPGIGNRFLQKFFSEAAHRVNRISLELDKNGESKFLSFSGSLKKFDRSDRKFAILSAATGYSIYNSTDSDWIEHMSELSNKGVKIEFLCGCTISDWFE